MKKVFAIVLHYGDLKITTRCISSVFQNLKPEEVIVVDNDLDSRFRIQDLRFRKLKIIKNVRNLGYAGGVNVGIKYAISKGADYILLLNNDILVEEDFVTPLIKLFSKRDIGITGPAIKFKRMGKTIYDLGGRVDMMLGKTKHTEIGKDEMLKPFDFAQGRQVRDDILEVDYVSGCCMLIKKEVFDKIGFFDEDFFLYYEDVDFCLRAKKAGFLISVLPSVYIYHELSGSIGKSSDLAVYHQTKSGLIFAEKHLGLYRFFNFIFIFLQSFFLGRFAFLAIFNYLRGRK